MRRLFIVPRRRDWGILFKAPFYKVPLYKTPVFLGFVALSFGTSLIDDQARASDAQSVEISIKDHKFEPEALKLPKGTAVKITVKNLDPSPEEFESTDLGFEKVVVGHGQIIVRLKPMEPGNYIFFGDYNPTTALGHIVVE